MYYLTQYVNQFQHLRRGVTAYGSAPHKLILLLAVLAEAESGYLRQNRIELSERLVARFQALWKDHVHTEHKPVFALPFFHMRSEGFWHLHAFPQKQAWLDKQPSISSLGSLRAAVEYASLDPELFALLQDPQARAVLKETLLSEFRGSNYSPLEAACLFCNIPVEQKIMAESQLALAFLDRYPVSSGHTLIIPKRHVASYFELEGSELKQINELCFLCKDILHSQYHPDGFNVGFNVGRAAGQSIFHCHMHLIPRFRGDVANPCGGVRAVIPDRQNYGEVPT